MIPRSSVTDARPSQNCPELVRRRKGQLCESALGASLGLFRPPLLVPGYFGRMFLSVWHRSELLLPAHVLELGSSLLQAIKDSS
jgi:hypothetical protein